ncbi:Protein kinase [Mortierella polycephala]|uniref:non-specific serine/threonine protein kinase n=1 Tax=Mortierella polycephala TaxID=41804 RepID=A0A9P6Q6I5_9FUNG|nr:Protein kinase [Mortierella polycephala]
MTSNIKIGPYMLLETLGVGSFGKVKRAVHSLTGHTVAIKIINKNKVDNQDMFARVKREIQYLKLLRHPHIIKLYEVISTPTSIYMVIEYAGGELFNYIVDNTRLSEDEARRFFQQIVCAIEYCHRHKIVHRDLKPENLLLDPSMNVKIADFGLSNIMTDGDFLKTSCGSPNYAAPEVISGKLYAGPEVDRITIAEIRQNAWFNVGLPEYLKPLPQGSTDDAFCNLQEDIITELMKKMNFSRETIIHALEERQNNQIKVAYQLVVDHRRMIDNASQMSPQKPFQSFLATSPPPWNVTEKDASPNKSTAASSVGSALKSGIEGDTSDDSSDSPVPSSIAVLSTSLPGNSLAKELHRKASLKSTRKDRANSQPQSPQQHLSPAFPHQEYATTAFHQAAVLGNSSLGGGIPIPTKTSGSYTSASSTSLPAATQRRMKARPKWYFGIRSRSAPKEVMAEIYRALSNLSMRWKTISPYHLRAKFEYAEGFEVKIELQLYRLDNENYLVDFKYVGQQSAEGIDAKAELLRSVNNEYRTDGQQPTQPPIQSPILLAQSSTADPHPSTAIAQGAGHIVSGPQDIPQPHVVPSGGGGIDQRLPTTPLISFQGQGQSIGSGPADVSLGLSLPASGPGILSSSLMQEQQFLKNINEKRQERQHHQRQQNQKQRPTNLLFPRASYQLASAKEVTSPFPFFDVCGKLITELAIGSS